MSRNQVNFPSLTAAVISWHKNQGGFLREPSAHALRLLREVIELCIATGALPKDISAVVSSELHKEMTENVEHIGQVNPTTIPYEIADVQLLLIVLASYQNVDILKMSQMKLEICWERKWQVDQQGVLWRPGHRPT